MVRAVHAAPLLRLSVGSPRQLRLVHYSAWNATDCCHLLDFALIDCHDCMLFDLGIFHLLGDAAGRTTRRARTAAGRTTRRAHRTRFLFHTAIAHTLPPHGRRRTTRLFLYRHRSTSDARLFLYSHSSGCSRSWCNTIRFQHLFAEFLSSSLFLGFCVPSTGRLSLLSFLLCQKGCKATCRRV